MHLNEKRRLNGVRGWVLTMTQVEPIVHTQLKPAPEMTHSQSTLMEEVDLEDDLVIMDKPSTSQYHFSSYDLGSPVEDQDVLNNHIYEELELDDGLGGNSTLPKKGAVEQSGWFSALWGSVLIGLCMAAPKETQSATE